MILVTFFCRATIQILVIIRASKPCFDNVKEYGLINVIYKERKTLYGKTFRNLWRINIELDILEQVWFICWVKFKCSSIKIPKKCIQVECKMICPISIEIDSRSATEQHEYNIYLVFEILIWILVQLNQLLMYCKFWLIIKLNFLEW